MLFNLGKSSLIRVDLDLTTLDNFSYLSGFGTNYCSFTCPVVLNGG